MKKYLFSVFSLGVTHRMFALYEINQKLLLVDYFSKNRKTSLLR